MKRKTDGSVDKRTMPKPKLTPWQKIIRAADDGTGLRLSADEIGQLGMDGAIETRSSLDDLADEGVDERLDGKVADGRL